MQNPSDHSNGPKSPEIIVNGTPYDVPDDIVSYAEAISLAYPEPPAPDTRFTVTFYNAHKPKEGTLTAGGTVEVKKKGTVFNVKATIKS
ncbi:multiubiquitin domain-containing protein [Agromyces salentinus]|uniref:Multi-ubiquitin domain-containing protein n=1 Tax=Agromyces salentinus TaxID=269421 RepID=A0ABN2MN95_9MICO|nr:multiubiquitin domain-containing protein [Agromyces salentinus]